MESTAETKDGQVMVGSLMVIYSALKHDVGDLGWGLAQEAMAVGSDG